MKTVVQKAAKPILVPENAIIKTGLYRVFGRRISSTTEGSRELEKLYGILILLRVLGDLRFYLGFYLFEEPLCFYLKKKNVNLALESRENCLKPFLSTFNVYWLIF